jgi:uncharacterized membrane protein
MRWKLVHSLGWLKKEPSFGKSTAKVGKGAAIVKAQILKIWVILRSSFWFLPVVMSCGAVISAFVTVVLSEPVTDWLQGAWGWTFSGGAEGASSMLGTIAGSMITIAGVVFSMTLVALTLVSSQLGPRVLRNFMSDTITQVALGTFVATFLYCLIVIRTIRRVEEVAFVPHLSVTLGVLFAVVNMGVLIYFIHHVSVSIQANEIVARVGRELIKGIDRLFPENTEKGEPRILTESLDAGFLEKFDREARPIGATGDGYLQLVNMNALMSLAIQEDAIIRLERLPGHYVVANCPLVLVWPGNRVTDQLTKQINLAFALGRERNPSQDIEFAVSQLVEIALRALSPSLNDPFTAIACVDSLGSALCRLAQRDMPLPYLHDKQEQLRVIAPTVTFPAITDTAFNQIRQYGRSCAAVTIRLLETISVVARFTYRPEDRAALLRHAEMIVRGARTGLSEEEDRWAVEERYHVASQLCSKSPKNFKNH